MKYMFSSYQPKNSFDEYFKDNVNSAREILIPLLSSLDNMGLEEINRNHSAAKKLLNEIKEVHGDDLLFHQSGGCCDGSAPMCFPAKEYQVGNSDVKLGEVDGTPFYMNEDQYEKWKHTDLTIDAVKGIGGMFSLDNGTGQRFLTKSEICVVVDNDKKATN